jgi:uncharacterized protein (TIGR02466 family)
MDIKTISAFSIPILLSRIQINPNEISFIKDLDYRRVDFDNGFISSNLNILNLDQLLVIKQHINDLIAVYAHDILKIKKQYDFFISTSWANIHSTDDFAQEHNHANSIFSGIVYIDVDDTSGEIIFYNPTPNLGLSLEFEVDHRNQFMTNRIELTPCVGDVIIFPSSIKHSVSKNKSLNNRYSLAFNVFAKGVYGNHERTLII